MIILLCDTCEKDLTICNCPADLIDLSDHEFSLDSWTYVDTSVEDDDDQARDCDDDRYAPWDFDEE